jgi:CheY-like chemotaxis protein/anti-sigma regulatory factor (Ser/Thr protein kinase)
MSKIFVVDADPAVYELIQTALAGEGCDLRYAPAGQDSLTLFAEEEADLVIVDLTPPRLALLEQLRRTQSGLKRLVMTTNPTPEIIVGALRQRVCDFLTKPFTAEELRAAVNNALTGCPVNAIEVVSASPDWVELQLPCDLTVVGPLQRLLTNLTSDLPKATGEALGYAFREMLNNAIEHGCKLDLQQRVQLSYIRLKRAIICRIKDPGAGFDPGRLEHAAISNPDDDPLRHIFARIEQGMRAGGFGILLTSQMVDELVYNEWHNELLFVKYLSRASIFLPRCRRDITVPMGIRNIAAISL